jgi:hypothetical protein
MLWVFLICTTNLRDEKCVGVQMLGCPHLIT